MYLSNHFHIMRVNLTTMSDTSTYHKSQEEIKSEAQLIELSKQNPKAFKEEPKMLNISFFISINFE